MPKGKGTVPFMPKGKRKEACTAIARFSPGEDVRTERDAWRQQFLSIVFRVLHEERERLAREPAPKYEDVVRGVEGG